MIRLVYMRFYIYLIFGIVREKWDIFRFNLINVIWIRLILKNKKEINKLGIYVRIEMGEELL